MNISTPSKNPTASQTAIATERNGLSGPLKLPPRSKRIAPGRSRRSIWPAFLAILFFSLHLAAQPAPSSGTNSNPWLDSWSFSDTNYWTSDLGYYPISFTNLSVLTSNGLGNSLLINTTNESQLLFGTWNSDGTTNLNLTGEGSLMFWFNPDWSSISGGGSGPGGDWSALIDLGAYTKDASYGSWSCGFDSAGDNFYFITQDAAGDEGDYIYAPVTLTAGTWNLIVLTWSSTNTTFYLNGAYVTNGPGVNILPSPDVISNGFALGSDAATGTLQMHGALNRLTSYNYALDPSSVDTAWVLDYIFYLPNPNTFGNFTNAPYSPGISDIYDVVSGPGYLQVIGTNTTTCFTNSNVWITNVTSSPGTNGSVNLRFMVVGGNPDLPYDVFAAAALAQPITNSVWSWLGQAYPCETNVIYGLTNRAVYLLLGTPLSYDGDGFTVAFDNLILHINPYDPDVGGDGIANGFKFLAGLPLTTPVAVPSLNSVSAPCCPIP